MTKHNHLDSKNVEADDGSHARDSNPIFPFLKDEDCYVCGKAILLQGKLPRAEASVTTGYYGLFSLLAYHVPFFHYLT